MSDADDGPVRLRARPAQGPNLLGFLTEAQFRAEWGIRSKQTVHNWIKEGLPCFRLGGKLLFDVEQTRAFILSRRVDLEPRKPGRPRGHR
jgi:hypothetical protein